ncbi:MAG: phage major capsid protein, partial [Spirochaetaceae bacterium]|nr:phage major capsid protein [Spirochaetaceae bacterium]
MDDILNAIKKKIGEMKRIEQTGFTNTENATSYFQEKELILEGIVKALETVTGQESSEVEALKSTVQSLREEIKGQANNPRELSRRELLHNLGKGIASAWAGNHKALAELAFSPNLKSDNWTNPKDVIWGEKGWSVSKAALG